MKKRIYICIDLKSFYASVECVARGLDPFTANLVVADPARQTGTICLAISPAMKALGVKNRCRVFEIPSHIKYIMAKPRMRLYMEKSAQIYSIYLRYICAEDIHVYSIDECFIDATDYCKLYHTDARGVARLLMDAVMRETGIAATVGIGTNLFLAKVALDITAKHAPDRMGILDEEAFRRQIWHHRPITDIWNIGQGTAKRLAKMGIFDLYGVAHTDPRALFHAFGVNAELLIDHANGRESCTIEDIRSYQPKSSSITSGQVLFHDYDFESARLILHEMTETLVLELIRRRQVTGAISLSVGYSGDLHRRTGTTLRLAGYTNSYRRLQAALDDCFTRTTLTHIPIRRINIGFCDLVSDIYTTVDLFTDHRAEAREQALLKTVVGIKDRYGKNAILRGINFEECATMRDRNQMIGGHNEI